ncbi:hypothetical protein J5TS1_26990 [Bacillus licheniformis]|nr:hypothetical protein BL1202_01683 [Bacillus licheniformis]GIN35196.1 hypothetical protein J5TS1_26990 [Bacillus licheniformis]
MARSLPNIIITSLAYNMKRRQTFFFSLILLSVATIGMREMWTNLFTTVIMVATLAVTVFVIIKDVLRRK